MYDLQLSTMHGKLNCDHDTLKLFQCIPGCCLQVSNLKENVEIPNQGLGISCQCKSNNIIMSVDYNNKKRYLSSWEALLSCMQLLQ